jgi:hypothetical protein
MHLMMASLLLTGSRLPSGAHRRANGSTSASRSGRRPMPSMAAHDLFRIRCKDPATEVRGKITSSEFSDRERSKRAHFFYPQGLLKTLWTTLRDIARLRANPLVVNDMAHICARCS